MSPSYSGSGRYDKTVGMCSAQRVMCKIEIIHRSIFLSEKYTCSLYIDESYDLERHLLFKYSTCGCLT